MQAVHAGLLFVFSYLLEVDEAIPDGVPSDGRTHIGGHIPPDVQQREVRYVQRVHQAALPDAGALHVSMTSLSRHAFLPPFRLRESGTMSNSCTAGSDSCCW